MIQRSIQRITTIVFMIVIVVQKHHQVAGINMIAGVMLGSEDVPEEPRVGQSMLLGLHHRTLQQSFSLT
jgi:hypothetical protein